MIIDFHTHAFPDALAPRAMGVLTQNASVLGITPRTDGTAGGLIASMDAVGIDMSVVCNIATNPHQMHKVNDFAIELKNTQPRLIPLGSLHPDGDALDAELKRLKDNGIKGIKIHPDYIKVHLDDPLFDRIFSLCEEYEMFVISHTGYDPVSPEHFHATPDMILNVIKKHPRLTFIAAHIGGLGSEEEVMEKLIGQDIYLDTSLLSFRPEKLEFVSKILSSHDPDKLLFATDTPWGNARLEVELIKNAEISDGLKEKIFSLNAKKLLGIDP